MLEFDEYLFLNNRTD